MTQFLPDIHVTPEDVARSASAFATGQSGVCVNWDEIAGGLQDCGGMAGHPPDHAALAFAASYSKAADAVWTAFHAAVASVGAIAECLGVTAGNYLNADHKSTISLKQDVFGGWLPGDVPFSQMTREVVAGKSMAAPPGVLGHGGSSLPSFLAKYWPTGNAGALRAAASTWSAASSQMSIVCRDLDSAIADIADGTAEGGDIYEVWSNLYAPGDESTALAGIVELSSRLATACTKYANAVDHAHHKAKEILAAAGAITALGLFFTPETLGASDAGAATADYAIAAGALAPVMATLAAVVAGVVAYELGEEVIHAVENGAVRAPQPQPHTASAQSLQNALDREVGIMQSKKRSREQTATLSPEEEQAVNNKKAGLPYDRAAYNRAMRKINMNQKTRDRTRNKQKRNG